MAGMKRDGKQRGGCLVATIACLLLLLPLLYLLSIGPALWLLKEGYFPGPAFGRVYYPLTWLSEKSQWFGEAIGWYMDFWA